MNPEKIVYRPLLLLVILSPLPLASVMAWSWSLIGALTGIMLLVWTGATLLTRSTPPVLLRRIWLPVALFVPVVLWSFAQMSPATPESWHYPLWADVRSALGPDVAGGIAPDPYETGSALLRLLSYAGVFWLALQCCRDSERAYTALRVLAGAGLVYGVYGLAVFFSGSPVVLWFQKISYLEDLTSTFVNRNSYATYAGLGLICVTALLTRRFVRVAGGGTSAKESVRLFLVEFVEREWFFLLVWLVLATALLLTHSRAGFASTGAGLAAFFIAVIASPSVPSRAAKAIAASVLAAGMVFVAISGDDLIRRLSATSIDREQVRQELARLSMDAIASSPLTGTGLGSFEQVFHVYRGDTRAYKLRSRRAHNTYLENTMELGIPAAIALYGALGGLLLICILGIWRRRRDTIFPAVGIGATVLVGVHSLVDFSLQIPAVAVTYSLIMGLACAQSWATRRHQPGRLSPRTSAQT